MPKRKTAGIKWVTKDEFDAMVDSRARSVLGVSSKQFISRWNKGPYRKLDADTYQGLWN